LLDWGCYVAANWLCHGHRRWYCGRDRLPPAGFFFQQDGLTARRDAGLTRAGRSLARWPLLARRRLQFRVWRDLALANYFAPFCRLTPAACLLQETVEIGGRSGWWSGKGAIISARGRRTVLAVFLLRTPQQARKDRDHDRDEQDHQDVPGHGSPSVLLKNPSPYGR